MTQRAGHSFLNNLIVILSLEDEELAKDLRVILAEGTGYTRHSELSV